jgi:hypothetical protein
MTATNRQLTALLQLINATEWRLEIPRQCIRMTTNWRLPMLLQMTRIDWLASGG